MWLAGALVGEEDREVAVGSGDRSCRALWGLYCGKWGALQGFGWRGIGSNISTSIGLLRFKYIAGCKSRCQAAVRRPGCTPGPGDRDDSTQGV